jgi:hypothetical protein
LSQSSTAMTLLVEASWLVLLVVSMTARGRGLGGCRLVRLGTLIPIEIRNRQIGMTAQARCFLLICTFRILTMMR